MLTLSTEAIAEKNKLASTGAWIILVQIKLTDDVTVIRVCSNNENTVWPSGEIVSEDGTASDSIITVNPSPLWVVDAYKDFKLTDVGADEFHILSNTVDTLTVIGEPASGAFTVEGNTWVAFPFDLDDMSDTSKNEAPRVEVRIGNVTRQIEAYMEQANGGVGSEVNIRVIHSDHLDLLAPEINIALEVVDAFADSMWAHFVLGAAAPYDKRWPKNRILKGFCRYKHFGMDGTGEDNTLRCQYDTIDGTMADGLIYDGDECDRSLTRCKALANEEHFGGCPGIGQKGLYVWNAS